jgi:predicted GH43/DUF377 family glycosyl hydrolase
MTLKTKSILEAKQTCEKGTRKYFKSSFELERYKGNPILSPIKDHSWESKMVFNCAAVYKKGKIHLIYRARGDNKSDNILISTLGHAILKKDGVTIEKRFPEPIFEPLKWYEPAGCEDPRVTEIDDKYYMLYTAYLGRKAPPLYEEETANIAMASTLDFSRWTRHGLCLPTILQPEKNGVLFPEKINGHYVIYYRIEPNIFVAYSKSLTKPKWVGHKMVASPRQDQWDAWKIGAGPPPIKTDKGWLFIYHGIDQVSPPRDQIKTNHGTVDLKRTYRLGVMLIDKDDPSKILYRSKGFILEPKEKYEKDGFVPNVVFSCGAVVIDDTLYVYYGGADTVIGLATCKMSDLLKAIADKKI